MNYQIKIHKSGLDDIQDIALYYEDKSVNLGVRFKEQVRLQIDSLKFNPERFINRYQDVRCMVIKRFPYAVHFLVHSDISIVEIFAIIHTSRHPKFWKQKRLDLK